VTIENGLGDVKSLEIQLAILKALDEKGREAYLNIIAIQKNQNIL